MIKCHIYTHLFLLTGDSLLFVFKLNFFCPALGFVYSGKCKIINLGCFVIGGNDSKSRQYQEANGEAIKESHYREQNTST